ncbi:MAG: peptidase, partial [Clostridia bacterium]|nr:peptidase [Clostridia bacterium]
KAILLAKQAEADGLKALKEAAVDNTVLELKKYEALVNMSNGNAAKLIIPTDIVNTATQNTIFSETTGLGDGITTTPKKD